MNTYLLEHRKIGILLNTVLLIAVTVYFFILNQAMLTYADDHCRTYENFSVWNAARGAWKDYMLWSGRLPALFLNRLFLSASYAGILIFNLINSAFLLLLIFQVRRLLDT